MNPKGEQMPSLAGLNMQAHCPCREVMTQNKDPM
ncbi:hypothetical protein VQ7734_03153 [Vibrio quintilis]|uniref:Uncharacterized protein n=1 Tax=Vibrio quintilis TaxID=1117707 RepID=A0A1M7YXQ8_9VIBR|nr:hypothetical protein VQ7734_03153 [Vibrio quintilis]